MIDDAGTGAEGQDGRFALEKKFPSLGTVLGKGGAESFAEFVIGGVHFQLLDAVAKDEQAGVGQVGLERVVDEGEEHVVVLRDAGEQAARFVIATGGVADDADEAIVFRQSFAAAKRFVEHGGVRPRPGIVGERVVLFEDRAEDAVNRGAAALRTDFGDAGIVEDQGPDAILLRENTPGAERGRLRSGDGFHVSDTSEKHGDALIDEEQDGALAFLGVNAAVSLARANRDFPVDLADVIAGKVPADFLEVQAPAAQTRSVTAGEERVDGLAGEETEAAGVVLEGD